MIFARLSNHEAPMMSSRPLANKVAHLPMKRLRRSHVGRVWSGSDAKRRIDRSIWRSLPSNQHISKNDNGR